MKIDVREICEFRNISRDVPERNNNRNIFYRQISKYIFAGTRRIIEKVWQILLACYARCDTVKVVGGPR